MEPIYYKLTPIQGRRFEIELSRSVLDWNIEEPLVVFTWSRWQELRSATLMALACGPALGFIIGFLIWGRK